MAKSLAPTVRLGWIVCPPALAAVVAAEKTRDDRGSPALDQLALATLIQSGRFDRHLPRMRGMSAQRSTRATTPPQLVLAFGDLSERAIRDGIAAIADLLDGRS